MAFSAQEPWGHSGPDRLFPPRAQQLLFPSGCKLGRWQAVSHAPFTMSGKCETEADLVRAGLPR